MPDDIFEVLRNAAEKDIEFWRRAAENAGVWDYGPAFEAYVRDVESLTAFEKRQAILNYLLKETSL